MAKYSKIPSWDQDLGRILAVTLSVHCYSGDHIASAIKQEKENSSRLERKKWTYHYSQMTWLCTENISKVTEFNVGLWWGVNEKFVSAITKPTYLILITTSFWSLALVTLPSWRSLYSCLPQYSLLLCLTLLFWYLLIQNQLCSEFYPWTVLWQAQLHHVLYGWHPPWLSDTLIISFLHSSTDLVLGSPASSPPPHYFYCGKMGMKLTILTIVHVQFSGIHVLKPSPPSSYLSLASSVFICSTGLGGDLKKCKLDLAIFSLFKFFQDCRHLG